MKSNGRTSAARRLGSLVLAALFILSWGGSLTVRAWGSDRPTAMEAETEQMPETDRLAEPVLPESPTQVDIGRNLYYFHCMPCHGDRGQGLTDEWRDVWVEDHQNCWGRGCHTGRTELSAFYIPRTIPAVIGGAYALAAFGTAEDLFTFLRATQPPQRAGALSDSEYWALTGFLLHENGRPLSSIGSGAQDSGPLVSGTNLVLTILVPLLALGLVTWVVRWPVRRVSE